MGNRKFRSIRASVFALCVSTLATACGNGTSTTPMVGAASTDDSAMEPLDTNSTTQVPTNLENNDSNADTIEQSVNTIDESNPDETITDAIDTTENVVVEVTDEVDSTTNNTVIDAIDEVDLIDENNTNIVDNSVNEADSDNDDLAIAAIDQATENDSTHTDTVTAETAIVDPVEIEPTESTFDSEALEGPVGNYGPYGDTANGAFEDYAHNARKNTLANLNPTNATLFLDTVLFGPLSNNTKGQSGYPTSEILRYGVYETLPDFTAINIPLASVTQDSSETNYYPIPCSYYSNGGITWEVNEPVEKADVEYREIVFTYDDCRTNGVSLNGELTYAIALVPGPEIEAPRFFKYEDFKVRLADRTVMSFTGVDAMAFGMSCDAYRPMRSYMHIVNESTEDAWLYENFVASRHNSNFGNDCPSFASDEDAGSILWGRVAHSTHGVVNLPQTAIGPQTSLAFEILGNDSSVIYEKSILSAPLEISTEEYDIVAPIPMASVTLTMSDAVQFETTQTREEIRGGGVLSFRDRDGDGLPDSWETLYGLSPNEPSDAYSDKDYDYMNAFDEYTLGTSPSDSSEAGWLSDEGIYVDIRDNAVEQIDSQYSRYPLRVNLYNVLSRVRSKKFLFTLQLTGDAVFESTESTLADPFSEHNQYGDLNCVYSDASMQLLSCEATADTKCDLLGTEPDSGLNCTGNLVMTRLFPIVADHNARVDRNIIFNADAILEVGSQELHDINNYESVFKIGQ